MARPYRRSRALGEGFEVSPDRLRHHVILDAEISHDVRVRAARAGHSMSAELAKLITTALYQTDGGDNEQT